MEAIDSFQWPDDPPQDWWEVTGASLGMKPELVRFAAALFRLGGSDAKKNILAARLAGIVCGRTQAFRWARGVAVKKLLDGAAQIKTGKRPRLTELDIDLKIEDLINSPDALTVARGLELRGKRQELQRKSGEAPENDGMGEWRLEREYLTIPNGGCAWLMLIGGQLHNLKLLHDTYHVVMSEEHGPELWARFYALLSDHSREELDRHLADPSYQLEARKKIWAEIGGNPPGPIDTTAVDWRVKGTPEPTEAADANA